MTKYNAVTEEIIQQIKDAAPGHVLVGDAVNEDYAHDETMRVETVPKKPDVVVEARSTEEVAAVMKICNENHIPVTPRGAGTGLSGGAWPLMGGVVITTEKMNKILGYDETNMIVRVQAGVLLATLAEDCTSRGLMYPPDPGQKFATLGGNANTNAGGMRAVKYGTTRDYIREITVVLPTGKITKFGAPVVKNSSGYSLMHLMIGSEGTLGIITELTLKVVAAPKKTISLLAPFGKEGDGLRCVPRMIRAGLNLEAAEFIDRVSADKSAAYLGKEVFPKVVDGVECEVYLLMTFEGRTDDELELEVERAAEILQDSGSADILVADTPALKKEMWSARDSLQEAHVSLVKRTCSFDITIPISELADYMVFLRGLADEEKIHFSCFGHAGDGNLHIGYYDDSLSNEEFDERIERITEKAYARCKEIGGVISGEHGIGFERAKYLPAQVGEECIELMQGIKQVFDPNLILNPGKVCFALD